MDHADHVRLIRDGVLGGGKTWADLGRAREHSLSLSPTCSARPARSTPSTATGAPPGSATGAARRVPERARHADRCRLHHAARAAAARRDRDGELAPLRARQTRCASTRPGLPAPGRPAGPRRIRQRPRQSVGPLPALVSDWTTVAAEAGLRDTKHLVSVPSRFLGSIYSAVSFIEQTTGPAPRLD